MKNKTTEQYSIAGVISLVEEDECKSVIEVLCRSKDEAEI